MSKKVIPLIGNSKFILEINSLVKTLATNNASVLMVGEKGTGKRLIAQNIHYEANQSLSCFFEINCKSYSDTEACFALDSISKASAMGQRVTLFISSLNQMTPNVQNACIQKIKEWKNKNTPVKIISSVENTFDENVRSGRFSSELYYYLNSVVLNIMPLRQRKEDIVPIAEYYLNTFRKKSGIKFESFSDNSKTLLEENFWKGNIDELINCIQRAFIVGELPVIKPVDLGLKATIEYDNKPLKDAIDDFKREYLIKVLESNGWNQTKTAEILGIQRTYVIRLMNELQIRNKNK